MSRFDASESVDRKEWRTYIERLNLGRNYPGIQGVGFSRIIKPAELKSHIAAMRAEGFPDYTVRPPGERSLYTSIIYLEPLSGRNLAAFGYDMMSETTRAKAMRMAAESGKTAITGKVKLVQETHGKEQAGFLMYLPIYRKDQPLETTEERWKALQGFVYSPYRVDDLMEGILGKQRPMLDFTIFDGEKETDNARMFVSANEQIMRTTPPKMTTLRTIQAYGHTWTVRLQSRPEFEAGFQSPLNAVILALGGGISILLFALVSFLASRRERAEEMAERMTHDIRINEEKIRQSEARLHDILDGAEHLIISTDTEGVIRSFNRSAENHLGYLAEELVGKSTPVVFHDPEEVILRAQELTAVGTPVEPGFEVLVAHARQLFGGDTHEWAYIRKDGSRFPVSLTITALRDGQGHINAFLGIATDITERKLIEKELDRHVHELSERVKEQRCLFQLASLSREASLPLEDFFARAVSLLPPAWQYPEWACARIVYKNREYTSDGYLDSNWRMTAPIVVGGVKQGEVDVAYLKDMPVKYEGPFMLEERQMIEVIASQISQSIDMRQAEIALRESVQLVQSIVENIVDGLITINELGIVESFNKSAENIFGYVAAEVVGNNIKMLMPEPYHSEHDGYLHNYRSTGKKKIIGTGRQVVGQRKDSSTFPMDLAVSEVSHGGHRMFIGLVRDITERKQNEEELRKLSRAIEQSPVSVLITDENGNIEYVNAKFTEVTGYTVEESIGKNPRFIQSGLTPAEIYQSMWDTLREGKQWRGKLQNRKKNGELFWEEMYISAIRDAEGRTTNYVAVKEDITERLKIERMKSEFISTVSHELRTPLTSIRGSLSLMAGGVVGELPAAAKPLVDIAHKNSERLILLVNDILDMEKIEAGKMEFDIRPVNLMPLLKQSLESNRAYAEQYKVGYVLENDLPEATINIDANRLLQVLSNLLSNAAKFSHAGGKVAVGVERIDQCIRVAIKDNGPGIPYEFRDRIFQKFAQADSSDTRKKGGTGLGLSITKAIVEQMGGSIWFDSHPDVQTTFYIEFSELTGG
jgi:PAS domain S-box-containing protein